MKSLLFVVAIATCAANAAMAQDQAPSQSSPQQNMHSAFMDACGKDMQTYCASAQTRDARHACVVANKDKFSDSCKTFMTNHPMHQHQQGGQMQGPGNGQ